MPHTRKLRGKRRPWRRRAATDAVGPSAIRNNVEKEADGHKD